MKAMLWMSEKLRDVYRKGRWDELAQSSSPGVSEDLALPTYWFP